MVVEAVRGLHTKVLPLTTTTNTLAYEYNPGPTVYPDDLRLRAGLYWYDKMLKLVVATEAINNVMTASRISISMVLILTTLFCTTTLADWNTKQPPSSGKRFISIPFPQFSIFFYVKSHYSLAGYSISSQIQFFAFKKKSNYL